jgi:hypothetical protein
MSFMPIKTCKTCGEEKPLSEYYALKHMFDGHFSECKVCVRKRVARNIEKKKEDPAWVIKEAERCRIKQRKAGCPNDPNHNAASRRHSAKFPEKKKARAIADDAVKKGLIQRKPCEVCGAHRAQAHHDDYSKPLDVVWLCSTHHAERHVWLNDQKRIAKALALKDQRESQQQ